VGCQCVDMDATGVRRTSGRKGVKACKWYLVPSRNSVGYAWSALTLDDIEKSD